jgi:exodeoxyribonuclease V alpha subunit
MIPQETLRGSVERVTFHNADNGYSVLKIMPEGRVPKGIGDEDGMVSVVGIMPELVEGESVEFKGEWVDNPQYGRQFKAVMCIPLPPQNERGAMRYLMDNVYGVGEATAKRIYKHFGTKTMLILESDPARIYDVPGIKPTIAENVIEVFSKERAARQVMVFLQGLGLTSSLARRVYDQYGSETISIVQNDPYVLADDMRGVGFKRADVIARNVGLERHSPQRLRAGLGYTLSQVAQEGHVFLPTADLIQRAGELMEVDAPQTLAEMLSLQVRDGYLYRDVVQYQQRELEAIYTPVYYHSEVGCAYRLFALINTPSRMMFHSRSVAWATWLPQLLEKHNIALSEQQQGAVKAAMTAKVSVLTGGPGTGKTTTLRMVIEALEESKFTYKLASPTGRAAKRLSEATERNATTIHRLLDFNPMEGGFNYDEDNPLETDMLIIDESSMLDLTLFYNVLKALPATAHLLLVGDVDQLPSVGAGNVLRDVIESGVAHVTRLDRIFRQDSKSHIVQNAHRINQGDMPYMDNQSDDFFFFGLSSPEEVATMVVDIVKHRIPNKFGYHPVDDIQVLAPMYRGAVGVETLNAALQDELNGGGGMAQARLGGRIYRYNDKVMQIKNNYEKDVFNGDIGRIYGFHFEKKQMDVLIDGRVVTYSFEEAEAQLILAYCITTHRSQGSEYPVIVMPVVSQHYIMLQRNLLYTAITRAKKLVVLVGEKRAVSIAVNNNKVSERYSGLVSRLKTQKPSRLLF